MPSLSLRRIGTQSLHITIAYVHGIYVTCAKYLGKPFLALDPGEHEALSSEDATVSEIEKLKRTVKQLEGTLEKNQRDTEALRAMHDVAIRSYRGKLEDMKVQEGILRKQISDATQHESEMQVKARSADAEINRLRQAYDKADKHIATLSTHVRQVEYRATDLQRALSAANGDRQKTAALLETRTAELHEAQAYLTKVDGVTETEVLRLVNALNSRIFQTASSISDQFESRYGDQKDSNVVESASSRLLVSRVVSPHIARALCSVGHETDSVLAMTALQAAMITYAHWLCSTWDFGSFRNAVTYEMVYAQIREQEPRSVSGRWRALTRTHLSQAFRQTPENSQHIAGSVLAEYVADVLLACSVDEHPPRLLEEVQREFGEALREIVELALEFHRTTGESIVSRDLLAVFVPEDTPYDPQSMEDEWMDAKSARKAETQPAAVGQRPVLCITQLGLRRVEGGVGSTSIAGEVNGAVRGVLLLKPHVVLMSMLEELNDEQKTRRDDWR